MLYQFEEHPSVNGHFGQILQDSVIHSAFLIVSYQLNHIPKDPQTHSGVYFDHLDQFGISLKDFENIVECVGRVGVFQIVSFKVKRCLVLYSGSSQRDGFGGLVVGSC